MGILVENSLFSLRLSLTVLRFTGFWPPKGLTRKKSLLYNCYGFFWFMFIVGMFLTTEVGDLFIIWGNLPLMTGIAFVLFTNLAHTTKFINIVARRNAIIKIISNSDEDLRSEKSIRGRNIIESCNREARRQQLFYYVLTLFTCVGWAGSAEKDKLPLRAWYPYDTNKSPAYEIMYMHQVFSIFSAAVLNVSKDTLVTTLIAQCRCRLRLVGLSLRTLKNNKRFTEETMVQKHFRKCVIRHQKILETVTLLQNTFSEPTFAQFTVSLVIICATAFQIVTPTLNYFRLISMAAYLLTMMFQVFIYCYQGNQLSSESEEVARAAYDIPWYAYSVRMRKFVLIVMTRCQRVAKLTAGGFTTLSLNSFTGIIKMSYSFFTLLQQVTESK